MRFSVLLPTRNGGRYLANCVDSVLDQDYDDFELVISDNANTDETPDIIKSFSDNRHVRAIHQKKPLSVVDNWTAAYESSQGKYIIMLGDDDLLLPGYFRHMEAAIQRHGAPSCLIYNGFSYVHPASISNETRSFWSRHHFAYGPEFQQEAVIADEQRFSIVTDMFNFRQRIPLNMQTALFRRDEAERIKGGVFQPPFPDHYLLNALLLTANKWVYLPDRLVVVGVSPKSFGHYHYSRKSKQGLSYLCVDTGFQGSLPGNELINGMCAWLMRLRTNYPERLKETEINRAGYVRRQVYTWLQDFCYGGIGLSEFMARFRLLKIRDWSGLFSAVVETENWLHLGRLVNSLGRSKVNTLWRSLEPLENVGDIKEFVIWLQKTRQWTAK